MRYAHIAGRIFDVPLLIEPARARAILGALAPRMGFVVPWQPAPAAPAKAYYDEDEDAPREPLRPYRMSGGVAILDITGTLAHRADSVEAMSQGFISCEWLAQQLAMALDDGGVRAILLNIDSPGGEAQGVFDLADEIRAGAERKRIVACVNDIGCSGGYLLAAAAERVVVTQSARVGSIGVVACHIDESEALAAEGLRVTFIFRGDRKIDGNSAQPLSDEARESWQKSVDYTYALFTAAVARYRNMSAETVVGTQAAVYEAIPGIDAGLADAIGTYRDTLLALQETAAQEPLTITGATRPAALAAHVQETVMPDPDAAPALDAEAIAAQARTEARVAERQRLAAITGSPEAKGRELLAQHLAFETEMSAEAAVAVLKAAPLAVAVSVEPPANPFADAMRAAGNPVVGTDAGPARPGDESAEVDAEAKAIVDAYARLNGAAIQGRA